MSLFKGLDTPFFDSATGEPLAFGFVYFGQPYQNAIANPKVPYANQALSTPLAATQELTIAGKFEQEVWLNGDYSVIITDAFGVQQAEYLIVPEAEGGGGGGGVGVGALSIVSGVVTVNLAIGNLFTLDMTENVTDWVFTNKPGAGNGGSIMIRVTQGSPARTLALPVGSEWTDGSTTTLDVVDGQVFVLAMTSFDNFSTVVATMAKRGSA